MKALTILRYLEQFCSDLDNGRAPRRFRFRRAIAPLVIPAAIGLGGLAGCCAAEAPEPQTADDHVVVISGGGSDAGTDGPIVIDAEPIEPGPVVILPGPPPAPTPVPEPTPSLYSVPMPPPEREDCRDGMDNDRDGLADCADPDCAAFERCTPPVALYGVPMPERAEVCGDGLDNDRDGRADCADSDCRGTAVCAPAMARYMAPVPRRPEHCSDGMDNDRDGRVDCADPDCDASRACHGPVALYSAPPMR